MKIPQSIIRPVHGKIIASVLHGHIAIDEHRVRVTLEDGFRLLLVAKPPAVLAGSKGYSGAFLPILR